MQYITRFLKPLHVTVSTVLALNVSFWCDETNKKFITTAVTDSNEKLLIYYSKFCEQAHHLKCRIYSRDRKWRPAFTNKKAITLTARDQESLLSLAMSSAASSSVTTRTIWFVNILVPAPFRHVSSFNPDNHQLFISIVRPVQTHA